MGRRSGSSRPGDDPRAQRVERLIRQADAARTRGRLAQAAHALASARELAQPDPGLVAAVDNQLGILAKATGDFAAASRHYRRALVALRRHPGTPHLELADLYHNLGGLEHARGRYAAGEPWARKAVQLRARRHGGGATVTWLDRTAHAALLDGLGRHARSERIYRAALDVFRRRLGAGHYEVAVTLNNLGCACAARGHFPEAIRYLRRSLELKQRLFGAAGIEAALTLNNLATTLAQAGQLAEARTALARAHRSLKQRLGLRHPVVRRSGVSLRRLTSRLT